MQRTPLTNFQELITMLVERKEVVITPADDSSTSVGMMLLIALIVLAVGITAIYFASAGQNTSVIERTTDTNVITPAPAPVQQPFVMPAPAPQTNTIVVPAPAAPAPAAPAPAPAAPAAEAPAAE